jgi:hypothetical protein
MTNEQISTETTATKESVCSGGGGGKSTYQNGIAGWANVALPPETRITVNGKTFELKDINKEMPE